MNLLSHHSDGKKQIKRIDGIMKKPYKKITRQDLIDDRRFLLKFFSLLRPPIVSPVLDITPLCLPLPMLCN